MNVADDDDTEGAETKDVSQAPSSEISQILEPGLGFGRYKIKREIGEGGMGVVYEAHDPKLNRRIAIKLMQINKSGSASDTKSAKSRMLREAQAMAMVSHPNLIEVYDVGTYENNVFIAMEYIEGDTLRDWIKTKNRKTDWPEILKTYVRAARGVAAAHQRKLIHRDFKPENVMRDKDGIIKVMDFGLARANTDPDVTGNHLWANTLTQSGVIVGTPAYMSPEQILGEKTGPETDQFSFCVALFEALYGYRPFQGKNVMEIAKCVLQGHIQLPPKGHPVPGFILDALLKGLQTSPDERHDSMDLLIEELRRTPSAPQRPWLLYAVTGTIAATGLLFYWLSVQALEQQQADENLIKITEMPSSRPPSKRDILPLEDIVATVGKQKDDLRECLGRGLNKFPDLEGTVPIEFTVGDTGRVQGAKLLNFTFAETDVARCLVGTSMSWNFPTPAEAGKFTYEIALSQEVLFPIPKVPTGDYLGKTSAAKMRSALREERREIRKCLAMGTVPKGALMHIYVDQEGNGIAIHVDGAHRAVNWCFGEIMGKIDFPAPKKGALRWSTPVSRVK
jgi:serine/threonine protein kinase